MTSNGGVIMQLSGITSDDPSSYLGKYVVDYDPSAWHYRLIETVEEIDEVLAEFLTVSDDPADARVFPSILEAREFWMQTGEGIRWDGKPNRPLTAFHVTLIPVKRKENQ